MVKLNLFLTSQGPFLSDIIDMDSTDVLWACYVWVGEKRKKNCLASSSALTLRVFNTSWQEENNEKQRQSQYSYTCSGPLQDSESDKQI